MSVSNDDRILAACTGDRRAAEELLVEILPRVRNLVRYFIRNDSEIDDVAQDALVVVLEKLRTYRGDGTFTAWVDRIVSREAFAYLRRRNRRPVPSDVSEVPVEAEGEDFVEQRRVVSLLDELPLVQREAIVLHHVLEMSVPEVAAELGAPVETVRTRLRTARIHLRARGMDVPEAVNGGGE